MQPTITIKCRNCDKKRLKTIYYFCNKFVEKIPTYIGFERKSKKIVVCEKPNLTYDGVLYYDGRIYVRNLRREDMIYLLYILLHELIHLKFMNGTSRIKSHPLFKEGHKRKEALVSLVAGKLLIEMFGRKVL